ncbi:MAG: hypothetical protein B6U94_04925 [Thermofilum sp. ex4484_79]|nr:MAG: hypothetical protein B6U94_04925 [Thermofilum sp. ex4484_79]
MSLVCPLLYKNERGEYVCGYNNEVILKPDICLADYNLCPRYNLYRKGESIQKEETVKAGVVAREIKEKDLMDTFKESVSRLENSIGMLDNLWKNYEEEVSKVLNEWMAFKDIVIGRLNAVDRILVALNSEINKTRIEYELGLISLDDHNRRLEKLKERMKRYEEEKVFLIQETERLEEAINPHVQRVKLEELKWDIGKLQLSLAKLEDMFNQGKIDKQLYEKIKREIENELERIKRSS